MKSKNQVIPKEMRAVEISSYGGPDVLRINTFPVPCPGEREILVRVHAAGVNRPDIVQRQGLYPPPPGISPLPGLEVSGEVVACGKKSIIYPPGARITGLIAGGGYAEYVTIDERNALPVPDRIDYLHAAAIPETFFTVWSNIFDRGKLKAGETLLVHGGSSGIGTSAILLAKAFGAFVLVTAGSDKKCQDCLDLGADFAINYVTQDFVSEVQNFTHGKGVDVILDMIGGNYTERNYKAAAIEGRIVQIAFMQGHKAMINLNTLMAKRLIHTGSTLRARDVIFKAAIADALLHHVWPLLENGNITPPPVSRIFSLEQASQAHQYMEDNLHTGKIVLQVIHEEKAP